ncbi:MAG: sulfatase [Candidatus Hydrogenedentes bacterium]|nr:sulfatase [Candidatus Hydrogenedentota bacterium]
MKGTSRLALREFLLVAILLSLESIALCEVLHFELSEEVSVPIISYKGDSFSKNVSGRKIVFELSTRVEIYKYKGFQIYFQVPKNVAGDVYLSIGWVNDRHNGAERWIVKGEKVRKHDNLCFYATELYKNDDISFPIFEIAEKFVIVFEGNFSGENVPSIEKVVLSPKNDFRWFTADNIYLRTYWEKELDWEVEEIREGDSLVFWFYYRDLLNKTKKENLENFTYNGDLLFSVEVIDEKNTKEIWRFVRDEKNSLEEGKWRYRKIGLSEFKGVNKKIRFKKRDIFDNGIICLWGSPMLFRGKGHGEGSFPPIVLISCDTLRADRLIPYGYNLLTSPEIDKFSRDAVIFLNAYTSQTFTPVAHMSMLTGLFPENHGVTRYSSLHPQVDTLFEMLSGKGYVTSTFVGIRWWFLPSRGFANGVNYGFLPQGYCDIRESLRVIIEFLQNCLTPLGEERFFIFWHNFDLHAKGYSGVEIYDSQSPDHKWISSSLSFRPPELSAECLPHKPNLLTWLASSLEMSLGSIENKYLSATYDDCVTKIDYYIGEFLNYLRNIGLYDKALIIITADHGESLGEHNRYAHDDVYEHTIRVPLLIKFPDSKFKGTRVESKVILEDIVPTIVNYLNIPSSIDFDGVSLIDLLSDSPVQLKDRTIISRSASYREYSLIRDNRKVIYSVANPDNPKFFVSHLGADIEASSGADVEEKNEQNKMLEALRTYIEEFSANFHEFVLSCSGVFENEERGVAPNELELSFCADTNVIFYYLEEGIYRPKGPESNPSCVEVLVGKSKDGPSKSTKMHIFFVDKPQYLELKMSSPFVFLSKNGISTPKEKHIVDLESDVVISEVDKEVPVEKCNVPLISIMYREKKKEELPSYRPTEQEVDKIKDMGYF